MLIEFVLIVIALSGYLLWFRERSKKTKLVKALKVVSGVAEAKKKSAFGRRQAKQVMAVQERIRPLVKQLEGLKAPNANKRQTVLEMMNLKVPGIGVQVTDAAIRGVLEEIRG